MRPSGRALRLAGRVLGGQDRRCCSGIRPPMLYEGGVVGPDRVDDERRFEVCGTSKRWGVEGRLKEEEERVGLRRQHTVSVVQPWGQPVLQRRGFLSCGDGDEDSGLSRHFEEDRVIGYSPEQIFAVVAGVDLYEDFVPWCERSQVLWRKGDSLDAELEIGFKFFVERYISHVQLKPPHLIKTTVSQSNLFDHLNNEWRFQPGPTPDSCHLHFLVDFQFKSPLYRRVANMFFNEVQAQLVGSFEERCRTVYGPSLVAAVRNSDKK